VVVPTSLRAGVLSELHSGHFGVVKMKTLARDFCWWPGIDSQIERVTRVCSACVSAANMVPRDRLHVWEPAKGPWERVHADYAGPIDGRWYLVIVDSYSKWMEVYTVHSPTSAATISKFDDCFARFGNPQQLVTDNGTQFCSQQIQAFLRTRGIEHRTSAPYHPSTNGQAERYVQILKKGLQKSAGPDQEQQLNQMLLRLRNQPSEATKESPAQRMFNRRLRDRLSLLTEQASPSSTDAHPKKPRFSVGDRVAVRCYNSRRKWQTGRLVKVLGELHYHVNVDGRVRKVHQDQMRAADVDLHSDSQLFRQLLISNEPVQLPTTDQAAPTESTDQATPTESTDQMTSTASTDQATSPAATFRPTGSSTPMTRLQGRSQRATQGVLPKKYQDFNLYI